MKYTLLFLLLSPVMLHGQIITTVCNDTAVGFSGDGGMADTAVFHFINGFAIDGRGNIYIADAGNYRVRKINAAGIISTVAGNGTTGAGGDFGPATAASISAPAHLAADSAGNLYIYDDANINIRKVDLSGIITTVAGNGTAGYSGDGGPATAASIGPDGLAADDSGNIYLAETVHNRVRKINTAGIIDVFAGNGSMGNWGDGGAAVYAEMYMPTKVFAGKHKEVLIADTYNQTIRRVDSAGVISTIAGIVTSSVGGYDGDGVAATATRLYEPWGAVQDLDGNVYIADNNNNRVRKIDTAGVIHTIAGTGVPGYSGDNDPATAAMVHFPYEIAVDAANNVYFYDESNSRLRKISGITGNNVFCASTTDTLKDGNGGVWSSSNLSVAMVGTNTGIVSGITPGTAIITYTRAGVNATAAVTVLATPAGISGTTTLCAELITTLSDASPGGTWSGGETGIATIGSASGTVTAIGAGSVPITYTLPDGCWTTTSFSVNPLPFAGSISGAIVVCETKQVTLSDGAIGGAWSTTDAAVATVSSGGVVTGIAPGTATISYTVTNLCAALAAVHNVEVRDSNCPVEVPSVGNNRNELLVFPNPASSAVTISSRKNIGLLVIKNILGQTVYAKAWNKPEAIIDIKGFPAGIYMIQVDGTVAGKFVKE